MMKGIVLSLLFSAPVYGGMMIAPHQAFNPFEMEGLDLALDADRASSFIITDSSVSTWNDLSGNGNHVTQATGASMPVRVSTNILNGGRYAVIFDGNDVLEKAEAVGIDGVANYTFYFVLNRTFTSGNKDFFYVDGATIAYRARWVPTNGALTWLSSSGSGNVTSSRGWGNISDYYVRKATYDGSNQRFYFEGTNDTDAFTGTIADNPTPTLRIGDSPAAGNYIGGIAQIMCYNRLLSTSEQTIMSSYFKMKFGIDEN